MYWIRVSYFENRAEAMFATENERRRLVKVYRFPNIATISEAMPTLDLGYRAALYATPDNYADGEEPLFDTALIPLLGTWSRESGWVVNSFTMALFDCGLFDSAWLVGLTSLKDNAAD